MLLVIDRHNGLPVYRQIMDQIRFAVASGVLAAGDELPSTRALSAQQGLNPMTVSKAYGLLEREGVLERRPGLSLVVAGRPAAEAEAARSEQLRAHLAPVAVIARQLGIDRARALELFGGLLDAAPGDSDA